ncbi:MAG: winged helix-turn-helix transcriptional regulator [Candidatus Omnitrophica bacterium]|nr:winged helix-turn-helix transcriptional regulator [Candidatus Omnitrophota bacterium]
MRIKKARQMLKSFADDTRLRVINLLSKRRLNVTELCEILGASQSSLSKHLARLRLTGVVNDQREGLNVYYSLRIPDDKAHKELIDAITGGLSELEAFKRDFEKLKGLKKTRVNGEKLNMEVRNV